MTHPMLPAETFSGAGRPWAPLTFLCAVVAAAMLGPALLTHYLAHELAYHPVLGMPWLWPEQSWVFYTAGAALAMGIAVWLTLEGGLQVFVPLFLVQAFYFGVLLLLGPAYLPFDGFDWLLPLVRDGRTRPLVFEAVSMSFAVTVMGLVVASLPMARARRRGGVAKIAHGSSRLATTQDLKHAGLLDGRGVRLGGWRVGRRLRPLADDSEAHVLAIMPTGAGKTTGIILPTLLSSLEPAFVLDPKGELWHRSAGWRAGQGHRCLRFSPTAASPSETLAWNPLDEVRRGPGEMHNLTILAENLVTVPAYLGHNHWTLSAQRLFQLLALHLLYASENPSLGHMRQLLNHPAKTRYGLFRDLLTYDHDRSKSRGWRDHAGRDTVTHPEVALLARSFLNTPDRELGSIVSTLQTYLQPWANPAVALNTAVSDFLLAAFTGPGEPITLYVALPYHDLETLAPLLRMMLALLIRQLTADRAEGRTGRTLFLLDEFASLGRLPILEKMLSFFRGYGVRAVLVIQDLGSLTKLYSGAETLSANCAVHVAAATQSGRTREHVSQLAGDTTVRYRHRALSRGRGSRFLSNTTFSDAEARRALFTPAEVGLLPRDRMILLKTGLPPVLAHRLPYFEDGELSQRARIKPPSFISARPDRLPPLPDLSDPMKQDQGAQESEAERDSCGRALAGGDHQAPAALLEPRVCTVRLRCQPCGVQQGRQLREQTCCTGASSGCR